MSGKRSAIRRCRVCNCSEYEPCNPPCAWAGADLCSTCDAMIQQLAAWMEAALHARVGNLVREAKALASR